MKKQLTLKFSAEKIIRYLLCTAMIFLMCFAAELFNDREIIFPETAALTVGAWLLPQSPWRVSRPKMVLLMTLSAFAGITVVRCITAPMPVKLLIGFVFSAICLTLSNTTVYPLISACILPIMMSTESIVYPVSVLAITLIIAAVNLILEKSGINQSPHYSDQKPDIGSAAVLWIKRTVIFSAALLPAVITGEYFIIAPPLIVTFVEFSPYISAKRPLRTVICICASAATGFGARCLMEFLSFPLWLCACIAMPGLFVIFSASDRIFPPAGAAALLPLIISRYKLFLYPVEIIIGCFLLMGLDRLFFAEDKYTE